MTPHRLHDDQQVMQARNQPVWLGLAGTVFFCIWWPLGELLLIWLAWAAVGQARENPVFLITVLPFLALWSIAGLMLLDRIRGAVWGTFGYHRLIIDALVIRYQRISRLLHRDETVLPRDEIEAVDLARSDPSQEPDLSIRVWGRPQPIVAFTMRDGSVVTTSAGMAEEDVRAWVAAARDAVGCKGHEGIAEVRYEGAATVVAVDAPDIWASVSLDIDPNHKPAKYVQYPPDFRPELSILDGTADDIAWESACITGARYALRASGVGHAGFQLLAVKGRLRKTDYPGLVAATHFAACRALGHSTDAFYFKGWLQRST